MCGVIHIHQQKHLQALLASSRRIAVYVDCWTQKGLTASYIGVSACFYDTAALAARHAILSVLQLQHPHTGEKLSQEILKCLEKT